MPSANVIQFPVRRLPQHDVSAPTPFDANGWLEITPEIYDWFAHNPDPSTSVHMYGFLHGATHHAFVCIKSYDGGFVCGMSNRKYSVSDFAALLVDENIDHVIEALGYTPVSV